MAGTGALGDYPLPFHSMSFKTSYIKSGVLITQVTYTRLAIKEIRSDDRDILSFFFIKLFQASMRRLNVVSPFEKIDLSSETRSVGPV